VQLDNQRTSFRNLSLLLEEQKCKRLSHHKAQPDDDRLSIQPKGLLSEIQAGNKKIKNLRLGTLRMKPKLLTT